MNNDVDTIVILAIIALAVVVVLILVNMIMALGEFSKELRYLNCEIGRTSGREQQHYKKLRRRLWLSLLPFVKY